MTLGFHSYGSYKCSLKAFTIAVQDKRQQVNTTWEARNNTRAVLIIKSLRGSLSQFSTNGGILLIASKISLGCSQVCNSDGQWSLLLKFQSCGLIQSLLLLRRVREIHFALNCKFEVFITFKVRQIRLAFTCTSEEELLGEYWFFPSKETWLVSSLIFKNKRDFFSFLQNLGLQTGDSEMETSRRVKFIQVQSVWTAFTWRDRDSGQLLKTQTRSTVSCSFSRKDRYHP